ncbi:MAG: diguanylate cyclase [Acidimicrobiia bacterium]|nr:diguanylate cyclase [Acidimicrobiia bacterium]
MPSHRRRLACLAAGLVALGAAILGIVADAAALGLLAGAAGLAAGALGWLPDRRPASLVADQVGAGATLGADASPGARLASDGGAAALRRERGAIADATPLGRPAGEATLDDPPEELQSLVDAESGLFTESYLLVALEARIAAARRRLRPVSIVMLDVVEGLRLGEPIVGDPLAVSSAVRATLREADTAGRLGDGRYVLVLEDTNESGAVWTVERVRNKLSAARPGCTVWAGVACYPAHGFTLAEILDGADSALVLAREWRQDRIEVAASE